LRSLPLRTIITSNLSLDELRKQQADDRWASRISGRADVVRLTGADQRLNTITAELGRERADVAALDVSLEVVMPEVRRRLTEWQTILGEGSTQARQMLRTLLKDHLVFTPDLDKRACDFAGEGDLSEVFRGLVTVPKVLASQMTASWNRVMPWLRAVDELRRAA
jgi:hypothetical protein